MDSVWGTVSAVILAPAAGLARLLHEKEKAEVSRWAVLTELLVSVVSGYIALRLARVIGLTGDWLGIVCGVAGWSGPFIMFAVTKLVEKVLGLEKDSLRKRDETKTKEGEDT